MTGKDGGHCRFIPAGSEPSVCSIWRLPRGNGEKTIERTIDADMSESVKIGGIGKNPAIDKINSLNAMDVKEQAVRRMEQALLGGNVSEDRKYAREVPVDFVNADWKGERYGNRKEERNRI